MHLAALILFVLPCFAADIRLIDNVVYRNAKIISQDSKHLEIQTEYGKISIPLQRVKEIDGVPIGVKPSSTPASTPQLSASPSASSAFDPLPSAVVSDGSAPVSSATAPTPLKQIETPMQKRAGILNESALDPTNSQKYRWKMDLLLAGFGAFFGLWILCVARVQRDLLERREDPRFWTNVVVALPGIGYGLYLFARSKEKKKEVKDSRPLSLNEVIAQRERNFATITPENRLEFLDSDRKPVVVTDSSVLSGIKNAQTLLEEAVRERASDVHIEPVENEYRIRFRIDGIMQPRMCFERSEGQKIVSALKTLAQVDIAQKRRSQDGHFKARKGDNNIDFRVATAPAISGEKLVIRILNRHMGLLDLHDLGMPQAMMEHFQKIIHSRSGMILATGPTGSGKTSTIYSALNQIDAKRKNILTIEDPVEYELDDITQTMVNPKAGVTYESGLRSLLRQDPDVLFVGEMRDPEAAQIALRAALTGHLLFTSLHTKDAIGTIIRLEEMGIERHQLSSALLVVIAQRLVRVLCHNCRRAGKSTGKELLEIGLELPIDATIYEPVGCPECRETGYVGRTGIFEMVFFDDEMRQAVHNDAGEDQLRRIAREKGHRSFREDGAEKLLMGITSVEEVLQAN